MSFDFAVISAYTIREGRYFLAVETRALPESACGGSNRV